MEECLRTQSVESVTVTELARRAGLTRQTFYRNFMDKYDLINWYFGKLLSSSFEHMGSGRTVREGLERKFEYIRAERVFFAAGCPHEPGALLKMLQILSVYDLNMTKIESRPIKNSPGAYCFFVEFEGDIADANVRSALRRVSQYSQNFKLLGCY